MILTSCRSTSLQRSPSRDRTGTCTHLTLTRLYDEVGVEKCFMCRRLPMLGWLYRCTQDYDGFLPASDFHQNDAIKRLEHDAQLYTLSHSINEAAAKGHYTDRELDTLWKQKLEVRKVIRQLRPTSSSSDSTASSSTCSIAATATYSTLPSTESDTDLEPDTNHCSEYLRSCRFPLEPIQEVHDDLERDRKFLPVVKTSGPAVCNFKVCHNCRPNYRDRAWLSLNGVLKSTFRQLTPPEHELHNRKLSNVEIVKRIGAGMNSTAQSHPLYSTRLPVKRNSRNEFQNTVQRLLRDRDGNTPHESGFVDEVQQQTHAMSHHSSSQNLGTTTASRSGDSDTTCVAPFTEQFTYGIGSERILPPLDESAIFNHRTSTSSFTESRSIYHRRGFERMTFIKVPPRSAVSHCGESTSSHEPSTSHSVSSCPGIVEAESLEKGGRDDQEDTGYCLRHHTIPINVDEIPPPQKTPTGSISGSILGFKRTPKAAARFFID